LKTYFVSALLLLGVACGLPTDACGCSPPEAQSVVAGFVTRSDGMPVPNPDVRAEIRPFGCSRTASVYSMQPVAESDATGRYRFRLTSSSNSDSACVRLVARESGPAQGDSAVVSDIRVRFRYPSSRIDSIRVDLRLP
jgi:hypothetical protein